MHILVTAFDPFGGEARNPAQLVLEALPPGLGGAALAKLLLPTAFHQSAQLLEEALASRRPDALLMLGQAGGRAGIAVEVVGINLADADIPDNLGQQPRDAPLVPGGPAAYFASLPVRALVASLRDAGLPASLSYSAGTFVCNQLLYRALHFIRLQNLPTRAGFIHLPYLPEQAAQKNPPAPSMALADQVKAVKAALTAIQTG